MTLFTLPLFFPLHPLSLFDTPLHIPSQVSTILAVFIPPLFYFRVFVPCIACYDFEAAVAHEIGHLLGFDHPDEHWQASYSSSNSSSNSNSSSSSSSSSSSIGSSRE